ncbi:hypothetical protein T439DRAFT_376914 [Meredithblackwellia eburnea MCA 4105]
MTKPIPEGDPRQRPARSCTSCRSQKLKCSGAVTASQDGDQLADKPCHRCAKLGNICEFVTLRRKGRPRRLPKHPSEEQANAGTTSSASRRPTAGAVRNQRRAVGARTSTNTSDDGGRGAGFKMEDDDEELHSSLSSGPSPISALDVSLLPHPDLRLPPIPLPLPLPSSTSQYDDLATGYLSDVFAYMPLLPSTHRELTAYLAQAPTVLPLALAAVVYPRSTFTTFPLQVFNSAVTPAGFVPDSTKIAVAQAAAFSVLALYGRTFKDEARRAVLWLTGMVVIEGWNNVDGYGARERREEDKERIRMIWFEAWGLEVQLGMVSGVRSLTLYGLPSSVNPCENYNSTAHQLRAQALSLIAAGTSPLPTTPLSPPRPPLSAIAKISNTLTQHSYIAFLSATNAVERETAFNATMLSAAALIHSISLSYASSGFTCGLDVTVWPSKEERRWIRRASEMIFLTLRSSVEPLPPRVTTNEAKQAFLTEINSPPVAGGSSSSENAGGKSPGSSSTVSYNSSTTTTTTTTGLGQGPASTVSAGTGSSPLMFGSAMGPASPASIADQITASSTRTSTRTRPTFHSPFFGCTVLAGSHGRLLHYRTRLLEGIEDDGEDDDDDDDEIDELEEEEGDERSPVRGSGPTQTGSDEDELQRQQQQHDSDDGGRSETSLSRRHFHPQAPLPPSAQHGQEEADHDGDDDGGGGLLETTTMSVKADLALASWFAHEQHQRWACVGWVEDELNLLRQVWVGDITVPSLPSEIEVGEREQDTARLHLMKPGSWDVEWESRGGPPLGDSETVESYPIGVENMVLE